MSVQDINKEIEDINKEMKDKKKKLQIEYWNTFVVDKKNLFSIHNNLISDLTIPSNTLPENMYIFSNKVDLHTKVTNQRSSGRCWIFAALNMIRNLFITKYKLKDDFEFSQNYLFFWDKFERINYFINIFENTKNNYNLNSQTIQFLLKEPLGDGGQWQMFVNLVNKYGLIPKNMFPETKHSSNSRGLNMVLTRLLRDYCKQIRNGQYKREELLKEVFLILVKFLGKPPSIFNWEYIGKDNKFNRKTNLTPQSFYKDIVSINLDNYISITNDPRNDYNENYSVQFLGNVIEGEKVRYFNIQMNRIQELVKKSIDNNEPVWFGCDVGKFLNSRTNIMDMKIFDIQEFLGINLKLNKRERIEYGDSLMTHAMLITGYNVDELGNINRWEIENSWGSKGANSGYYTMTNEWMKEFVYQVAINKKYMTDKEIELSKKEIVKEFSPWDPMGALA